MAATILDHELEERVIAERQASGIDKFDEVWDGVYVMSPLADDEHQEISTFLSHVLYELIQQKRRGKVRQGINLSDRPKEWTKSFRVPDVAVFLNGGQGVNHGKFWTGGPDFAVEVVSEGEDPEAKFAFYAGLNTRELLLVHRDPWRLELYQPDNDTMRLIHAADVDQPAIPSTAVVVTFCLKSAAEGFEFVIEHPDGRSWTL